MSRSTEIIQMVRTYAKEALTQGEAPVVVRDSIVDVLESDGLSTALARFVANSAVSAVKQGTTPSRYQETTRPDRPAKNDSGTTFAALTNW